MLTPLSVLIGSVVLFTTFSIIVRIEEQRQRRLFWGGVRAYLDRSIVVIGARVAAAWEHFVHFVVKLGWYYSIHSFLRALMNTLVSVYDYLEHNFEKNRIRARALHVMKKEKSGSSQLSQVAEHKEQVALSPEEGEKLREEKLEERD